MAPSHSQVLGSGCGITLQHKLQGTESASAELSLPWQPRHSQFLVVLSTGQCRLSAHTPLQSLCHALTSLPMDASSIYWGMPSPTAAAWEPRVTEQGHHTWCQHHSVACPGLCTKAPRVAAAAFEATACSAGLACCRDSASTWNQISTPALLLGFPSHQPPPASQHSSHPARPGSSYLSVPTRGQGLVAALTLETELVPVLAQGRDLLSCRGHKGGVSHCPAPAEAPGEARLWEPRGAALAQEGLLTPEETGATLLQPSASLEPCGTWAQTSRSLTPHSTALAIKINPIAAESRTAPSCHATAALSHAPVQQR